MSKTTPPLSQSWHPVPLEEWRALLERDPRSRGPEALRTPLEDDLRWEPLVTPDHPEAVADGHPLPLSRPPGRAWAIEVSIDAPDLREVSRRIRLARRFGAETFRLRLYSTSRDGRDPDAAGRRGPDGPLAFHVDHFRALIAAAGPDATLALDAGAATPAVIALALAARGAAAGPRIESDADPWTSLATTERPPLPLALLLDDTLASGAATRATLRADHLHEAGATPAQCVAATLALLAACLRAGEERGADLDTLLDHVAVRFAVGRDVFLGVATLRALHLGWRRITGASGLHTRHRIPDLRAVTARRSRTTRDAWVNLLRNTGDLFAAAIGGARAIDVLPMDATVAQDSDLALRMAINAQRILAEESHLGHVADPAAGSWAIETMTRQLAEAAWSLFQDIEREGGILAALDTDGVLRTGLDDALAARSTRVENARHVITGVNAFPDSAERPLPGTPPEAPSPGDIRDACRALRDAHPPARALDGVDVSTPDGMVLAASRGATLEALVSARAAGQTPAPPVSPLHPVRDAAPFERLRDAAEAFAERTGGPPRAFLAALGPLASHRPRTLFSASFLASAGFDVETGAGGDDSGTLVAQWTSAGSPPLVVLCGADESWDPLGIEAARALREAGAQDIVLAGRPGALEPALREGGVRDFIHLGGPMAPLLQTWMHRQGVFA